MKKIIYFTISILFIFNLWASTPSENYLQQHSITEIKSFFSDPAKLNEFNQKVHFEENLPFFLSIMEQENEGRFIGYHASSMQFRIFQDILRATFEEVLQIEIPKDFYFFRVPGDPSFDLFDNKNTYFEMFEREIDTSNKIWYLSFFIFDSIREGLGIDIQVADLTEQEFESLWNILEHFIEDFNFDPSLLKKKFEIDSLEKILKDLSKKRKNLRPKVLSPAEGKTVAKIIVQVSQRLDQVIDEENIVIWAKTEITTNQFLKRFTNLFISLMEQDSYREAYEIWKNLLPYLDIINEQRKLLISMNIPLFGNYFRSDESTLAVFSNNQTISKGDSALINILEEFYDEIGLPKDLISSLFDFELSEINKSGVKTGCIYQFFDNPNRESALVDKIAFVSRDFGVPANIYVPSQVIYADVLPNYNNSTDLQLRMVMSNYSTLNPFSGLRIKRYDQIPSEISHNILEGLKQNLRAIETDKDKLNKYKEKLQEFMVDHGQGD